MIYSALCSPLKGDTPKAIFQGDFERNGVRRRGI